MEVAVTTDVGTGQRFNDDFWCHEQLHRNVTLLAVADGFGRPQGTSSATVVVDAIRDVIRRELRRATFPPRSLTADDIRELLKTAFAAGNDRLLHIGGGTPDRVAAGSTCTLVLIVSNQAFVAHVGDSRAYLMRRGELVQLTSDDSLQPEPVRSATIQPGALRNLQMPTLLTRALGVEASEAVVPKIAHYTLHAHDAMLLCTDGVSRGLGAVDLMGAVAARDSARMMADRIIVLARGAGSVDNATVLLAREATSHGPPAEASSLTIAAPWRLGAAIIAALALFVTSGVIVRSYWFGDTHLYLAQDGAGEVGLYAGVPGEFLGLPLHVERSVYPVTVSDLSQADQSSLADGMPVAGPDVARAVVERWQTQSGR
jgi:serine/threonine protein phosphatase PrpC